ncbi:EAL domain-containing protein [Jatrophihabitans telluris]|uniref:EAL domain-containing protein n=1 Tax=Jatrophihabitans telluris TaxID=2038343 RepID=A0ABY4QV66_9ACTN|nr:bifunctional diguanylate cyclase/phosphodiesterase [Jatrophihabitans telluris]UQX87323.1 EAL domain-containing protein [Jatrophihabitans telluris]
MDLRPSVTNVRRPLLERVLDVVRELGNPRDLQATLELIASSTVQVLGFDAAAIKVSAGTQMRVAAVAGPPAIWKLLGQSAPTSQWLKTIERGQALGNLRHFDPKTTRLILTQLGVRYPDSDEPGSEGRPEQGLPEEILMAPMWNAAGDLIGALCVDDTGPDRRPDVEQQTVLELFAAQAAIAIVQALSRDESEAGRLDAEGRWRLTFERSPIGAAIINTDGIVAEPNDTLVRLLGYPRAELTQRDFASITHPDDVNVDVSLFIELLKGERDSYEIEKRYIHADGHVVSAILHVGAIRDEAGGIRSIIGQLNDISDRKRAEAELAHRSSHDPVTALPNRASLEEHLNGMLSRRQRAGVLFLDIDRFKTINDSLGHEAGDELLSVVTSKLRAVTGASNFLARVGGDEFAVVVPERTDSAELVHLGNEVLASLEQPLTIRGHRHTVTVSIGVAATRPAHRHADEILREADQAMLRAKRHGRARVEVYDPTQDRPATVEDLRLEHSLRTALVDGAGLVPYFQPIISLTANTVVGYEALIRWQHPERGLLEPDDFLPLAEKTGLIVPLGWWMLQTSCSAVTDPALAGGDKSWVAVNVSGSQLGRGRLVGAIERALDASGVSADRLHLEITETALIEASSSAIHEVREVAELGVQVALDDFGTGYSSLTLLRDLPVSVVKIDRSFVAPIGIDRSATAIVRRLIALCQELGVDTVAEGVETQSQLTALRALGCSQAQGYLIGPPERLPDHRLGIASAVEPLRFRRSSA